jgi:serine/threonine protein kinase/Flp pilus assembly protein TadD
MRAENAPNEQGETLPTPPKSRKARRRQRYELQEQIGAGGMGTVYRAWDRELNRVVAVKVVRPEFASSLSSLLRLKRELVLASRISDAHVVRVHDFGEVGGKALIAMDWVDGESLASLLGRVHRLPPAQVCDFAAQICKALRAIHAANLVHRDLKPGNLLISRSGQVLVSDFGLARSALQEDAGLSCPAEDSCGTPRYMAPEQLAGLPADERSDLYSLGMVLLEMLTGTAALEALDPLRGRWIASRSEKHIRSGELRKLAALDAVIRGCLRLDRSERPASADAVLAELERAGYEAAPGNPPVSLEAIKTHLSVPRNKYIVAAAAVLLLLLGGLSWQSRGDSPEQLYAQAMSLMAPDSGETELHAAAQALDEALAKGADYPPAVRARVEVLIRLYEATGDAQLLTKARKALQGRAAAGLTKPQSALFGARIDLHASLFSQVIRNLQSDSALLASSADANRLLGRALEGSGQIEAALIAYRAAVRLGPESWLGYNDLGSALLGLGRLEDARQQFVRVTALHPASAAGFSNLGVALLYAGDPVGARQNFERALERQTAPETYHNLGITSYLCRQYASSIPFFQAAIRIRPDSDRYLAALGDALSHAGKENAAREAYLRAMALLNRLERTRPLNIEERCRRALCFARLGDFTTADSALQTEIHSHPEDQTVLYTAAVLASLEGQRVTAKQQIANAVRHGYPGGLAKVDPDLRDLF